MATTSRSTELEDLPDSILIEILLLTPVKTAHQCKVVSKRWLSLISSPHFADRRRNGSTAYKGDDEVSLIANIYAFHGRPYSNDSCDHRLEVHVLPADTNLSCDFLNQQWSLNIVSSAYNDLILTKSRNLGETATPNYVVSNPLTKKSYTLPQLLLPPAYCVYETALVGSVDVLTRYKAIDVTGPKNSPALLVIYVFSMDTLCWTKFDVSAPSNFLVRKLPAFSQYPTVLNGSFYWCTNMILVYDPFNNPQQCDFIDLPQGVGDYEIDMDDNEEDFGRGIERVVCITKVEQHLRLYHWKMMTAATLQEISVWDMKVDSSCRSWTVKHFVNLSSIDWPSVNFSAGMLMIKGFHPDNGDILYVFTNDKRLLAVNLQSKTVQLVSHFKSPAYQRAFFHLFFHAQLPWPTPINSASDINSLQFS